MTITLQYIWNIVSQLQLKKKKKPDFLAGTVTRNLPTNAGDMSLIPDPWKISRATEHQAMAPQPPKPEHY